MWHQKDRTIQDFNKAKDDWVAVASAGSYADQFNFEVPSVIFGSPH